MYVLIENEQIIHIGPIHWNQKMFQNYIKDDLELDISLSIQNTSLDPIVINNTLKILPAILEYPATHNPKIEQFAGPFWNVVDNFATGTFTNVPKDVNVVKGELKNVVATNRWIEETKGITINIQGQDVSVSTNRGERDIFLQALQLMTSADTKNWKFGDIWLTLTYTDLQTIVNAIVAHIQSVFDWDKAKCIEIDNANTLPDLDTIQLTIIDQLLEPGNRRIGRRNAI